MNDHAETLKSLVRAVKVYPSGFAMPQVNVQLMQREVDAIRAVLEENERLRDRGEDCDLCGEVLGDATCEKCVGRLEARIEAALALHAGMMNPQGQRYCTECQRIGFPCSTVKALRGEG